MKFCKNCGGSIKEDAKFCNHCGTSVLPTAQNETDLHNQEENKTDIDANSEPIKREGNSVTTSDYSANQTEVQTGTSGIGGGINSNQPKQPVKKISPKTKIIISIALLIVIAFIVVFKIGESMYSPNKTAEKFNNAIRNQDASALKKLIISDKDSLKIDQMAIESMLEYLDDNSDTQDLVLEHIKQQGDRLARDEKNPSIFEENLVFNLKKDGKFLVFDQYKVVISPVYFELTTNYKGTELFVNEESVGKSKKEYYSKKVGPYLPGTYEFKAKHKSKFSELETKKSVDNFDKNRVAIVDLSVDGQSVTFDLPFYDEVDKINLIINGKDTKIDLREDSTVQPMKTGRNVKAAYEAVFPWGKMRSSEFIVDSTYPYADFQVDEELQKTLKERIIQSEKEQYQALTTGGQKLPTKMNQELVEELKTIAEKDAKDGKKYKFEYLGSDFDKSSYTLSYRADRWEVEVKTTSHRKEELEYKSGIGKDDFQKKEKTKTYTFEYDEKAKDWIINSYDGFGAPDQKSIEEYREKDPQTFQSK